jgi:GT2 family glycosyltransferase
VLSYKAPYNFSAINNFAARQATGSFLCLLNNDTEVVEPDWLTEMMRYAVQPNIGAVGAKLLYEDGTIQHAGVVVGVGGAAGHAHRFARADQPGYFRQPHVSQYVSAVTAACLVVAKEKYDAVRGLDEDHLPVAFNDVDLCLKLQRAGWRNVYVPHAVLLHHESKSRGSDFAPERVERYRAELRTLQERWGTKTYQDPLHNPNLDRGSETYVIRI